MSFFKYAIHQDLFIMSIFGGHMKFILLERTEVMVGDVKHTMVFHRCLLSAVAAPIEVYYLTV